MDFEAVTLWQWITLGILLLEAVLRAFPNERITGIIGVIINLAKIASDYLNRESEDQKAMKKSRFV